jgi:hypothetical protein
MIDFRTENEPIIKEQVLKQIYNLDILIEKFGDVPIFFGQQNEDFSIKDVFSVN